MIEPIGGARRARPNRESRLLAELAGLRGEVQGLRKLLDVSRDLSSILDPDVLLEAILDAAILLTGARRGVLLSAQGQDLPLAVVLGRSGGRSLNPETVRISETLARRCLLENRVIPCENLSASAEFGNVRSIRALSLDAAVCLPLRERGVAAGVLYLDSSIPGLHSSAEEIALLEAFASQAAVCMMNARLLRASEESRIELSRENADLRAEAGTRGARAGLVGDSRAMTALFARIRVLKDTDIPVLLLGDSGTGKELVARALHDEGHRRDGPFVPVNCAGLPPDLLDSLMFGHRKGAFTGALQDMAGLVEQADGGTLFLDEVGDMPLALQVKLLRFLESGEYRRVGDAGLRRARVRLVSATNRDLAAMVRERSFREDLYFRIVGICLEIPPLRDRREDVPALIDHFLRTAAERLGRPLSGMTDGARALLAGREWPGNVRQLRHVVEGACALAPEGAVVDEAQVRMLLPLESSRPHPKPGAPGPERTAAPGVDRDPESKECPEAHASALLRGEREVIEAVLIRNGWHITRAAEELGVSRQFLHGRIKLYKLARP